MQALVKGDVVDIIVPASGSGESEYNAAIEFVRAFGLTPRFREFKEVMKTGLCSNTVDYRFEHLIDALSSDSKAVWCANGGYGSQQLLEKLDELSDPPKEKMFIGFSDITILLNYFADKWGWKCVHGPMPGQVGKVLGSTWSSLAEVVFGQVPEVKFVVQPLNQVAGMEASIEGKLMGGCLSLMQALIGTTQMPDLEGAILMLEDDKFENPRRIDRIFDQMNRAGVFYDVEAVILGDFLEGAIENVQDELDLKEVLSSLAGSLDERGIPLVQNKRLGHCTDMLTVLIGAEAEMKLGDKPEVTIKGVKNDK
jgi:muramoyltetrapeptide carboxypeptidase